MNNTINAIEIVLRYEIERKQSAWEMVQDGYNGDAEAYIEDYKGDYEAAEAEDGILVTRSGYDERWVVYPSGSVSRDDDAHIYEVVGDNDEVIKKTLDKAEAYNYTLEHEGSVFLEDGKIVEW